MVVTSFWIDLEGLFSLETSMLVRFGPCCFYFGKELDLKNICFWDSSQTIPINKVLKMTIESFHGLGEKSMCLCFVHVKPRCFSISLLSVFTCKSLNPSCTDPVPKDEPTLVPNLIVEPFCFYGKYFACIIRKIDFRLHIEESFTFCFYNEEKVFLFVLRGRNWSKSTLIFSI